MQAANENLASVNNPNPTPLHSLNSCFQHCRLHRGQRGEKKKKKTSYLYVQTPVRVRSRLVGSAQRPPNAAISTCMGRWSAGAPPARCREPTPRAAIHAPYPPVVPTRKIQQNTRVRDARRSLHATTHCTLLTCWSWAAHDRSATGTTTTARWHADRLASAARSRYLHCL
jgi:hypothetical protein